MTKKRKNKGLSGTKNTHAREAKRWFDQASELAARLDEEVRRAQSAGSDYGPCRSALKTYHKASMAIARAEEHVAYTERKLIPSVAPHISGLRTGIENLGNRDYSKACVRIPADASVSRQAKRRSGARGLSGSGNRCRTKAGRFKRCAPRKRKKR